MEAPSPKSAGQVRRLETQRRARVIVFSLKASAAEFTLQEARLLLCWVFHWLHGLTLTLSGGGGESASLEVPPPDLNVNLPPKHSHTNIQNNVWTQNWAPCRECDGTVPSHWLTVRSVSGIQICGWNKSLPKVSSFLHSLIFLFYFISLKKKKSTWGVPVVA